MITPIFKQIHPVDLKFATANREIDEFYVIPTPFAYNDLIFQIECQYWTTYGLIKGNLEFNKTKIQFIANNNDVIDTLVRTTTKQSKDINEEIIQKFSFTILLEDIYSIKNRDDWVQFYLFGKTGIELPVLDHENKPSVLSITLLLNQKCPDDIIQLIKQLTNNQEIRSVCQSDQVHHLMNYILKLNRYQTNKKTFRKILHSYQHHQEKTNQMGCLSQVTYYDIISIQKLDVEHKYDTYQIRSTTLNKPSSIISQSHFEQLQINLPQNVIDNPWYQVFNPKYHGNSFQEFLRRTKNVKEHLLIVKDDWDVIFGAYLEEGWRIDKKYYGSEQSFIFSFKNNGFRIYKNSKMNEFFQFCNQDGFIVGGPEEEDQFSIKINQNFLNGELNSSSTFSNELLSKQNQFKILEFEIWGVQQNCELIMRQLRLESYLKIEEQ
ncbi:unnamed protein product (macronuclear) [Paramecium tetraurelia]|uniref:TLDc domain-containing protein n=1 Tax=Paramecium tetraurelia TaxID=5888 RepID=A0DL52_PARTE|nr:uncharacterized protein GSPATT00018086001 [Paramecium tetraurelia]CAK83769.1 unnamed protein product [Paramecium tetraurelia]|eukprot:XP_001451166.1 hypothetical protein (macronuclear) [Paramecium tetraurelia strain d4-2]